MTLRPGRVLKQPNPGQAIPSTPGAPSQRGRRLPREQAKAHVRAAQLVKDAERRAAEIVGEAEKVSAEIRLRAETDARAEAAASVAAHAIALRQREARSDELALDRIVELAKLLAERLLGEELKQSPETVAALARRALEETRGARQVRIEAHPEDAPILAAAQSSIGLDGAIVAIEPNPERERGDLKVVTEIGVLDAAIAPQLERLALKLRERLGH